MTITEMHTKIDRRLDESGSPWFSAITKDSFLNDAVIEILRTRPELFEGSDKKKQDLAKITKKYVKTGSDYIDIVTEITDFVRIATIIGVFISPTCADESITVPVVPMQLDDLGDGQINPFTKGTNRYPKYIEYNDGTGKTQKVEVKSGSTPTSLTMFYVSIPPLMNSQSTPKVDCTLPQYVHLDVIDLAVRKMMMTIQSPNYPVQQNEINKSE